MNGTNKTIVGVVFGIALIYSALCLMVTLQNLMETGTVSVMVFLPHGGELGYSLASYLGPLSDLYEQFLELFTVYAPGNETMVKAALVVLSFVLAVAGMFTKPVLDCHGDENPAEYMFTHRPKAFSRCVTAPFGLIKACWAKHKALVILPVVLLPFYLGWSLRIMVFLILPFLLMRAAKTSQMAAAGKKEGNAYEKEIKFAVCPICKRNFDRPKVKCRCGLVLDYPVPNEYGIKYHTCNKGHDIPCVMGRRSELTTLCPYCGALIETREAKPISISMVGAVGTGKTTLMLASVGQIAAAGRSRDIIVEAVTPGISKDIVAAKDVVPKTIAGELDSECLFVRSRTMQEKEIVFNDISGQEFEPREDKELFEEYFTYTDGIIFTFDPMLMNTKRRGATPQEVFDSFHAMYTRIKNIGPSEVSRVPFAVVATKNDAIRPQMKDGDVRQFLIDRGQDSFVRIVESVFSNVRYFAVTSKGADCMSAAYPVWWIVDTVDSELGEALDFPGFVRDRE